MPIQLGKRRAFTANFTKDDGSPASIDEKDQPLSAVSTNGDIEDLVKTTNASGAVIGCTGKVRPSQVGPVEVQVTADADRGDGTTRLLTLVGTETCIEGEATGGTVSLDGPDVD